MVAILGTYGFGTLAAALIFVLSYARTDVVRLRSTLATRRSSVERSDASSAVLSEVGEGTVVLELSGYVFFGTADRLLRLARSELAATPPPDHLVIDLTRVEGLDASAMQSLVKIGEAAAAAGTAILIPPAATPAATSTATT